MWLNDLVREIVDLHASQKTGPVIKTLVKFAA